MELNSGQETCSLLLDESGQQRDVMAFGRGAGHGKVDYSPRRRNEAADPGAARMLS